MSTNLPSVTLPAQRPASPHLNEEEKRAIAAMVRLHEWSKKALFLSPEEQLRLPLPPDLK